LKDLLIGNQFYTYNNGKQTGQLMYFRNTGTLSSPAFTMDTDDYLSASSFGLFGLSKSSIPFARKILLLLSSLFIMMSVYLIQSDIVKNEEVPTIGLRMQSTAIAYIYNRVGQNKFCLKIYTPPVLTYTYDYIIDYYVTHKGVKNPQSTFIKHRCWYIIERDDYAERLAKWRTDQIPEKSAMIESRKISKDATVELWEIKTK